MTIKQLSLLALAGAVRSKMVAVNETVVDAYFKAGEDDVFLEFQAKLAAAEAQLEGSLTRTGRQRALEELNFLRRFRALKNAVLWMSRDPRFGKYCYYGCYCLSALHEAEGDLAPKQKGEPRDGVDAACKVQFDCYHCMKMDEDVKSSCTTDARYHYELLEDDTDAGNVDKRDIRCTDKFVEEGGTKKTHCKRAVCECDRGLAMRLSAAEGEWNEDNHKKWGGFNDNVCNNQGGGGGNGGVRDDCCGRYTNDGLRFPYDSNRSGCCDTRTYSLDTHECCAPGEVRVNGGC